MMQANWSLILNVLLLIGVIIAISRLMKMRRRSLVAERYQPTERTEKQFFSTSSFNDDIIAVRKVNLEESAKADCNENMDEQSRLIPRSNQPQLMVEDDLAIEQKLEAKPLLKKEAKSGVSTPATLVFFLLAKENRQFAGYELLQTVLASGLRFGEGHLFHRHQLANGQGLALCSLAAATATGVFDLQNIGAFSVRGLCLFMQVSKNADINAERFSVMLETARQLREGLDAYLLDDQRKPLTSERIAHFCRALHIEQEEFSEVLESFA